MPITMMRRHAYADAPMMRCYFHDAIMIIIDATIDALRFRARAARDADADAP